VNELCFRCDLEDAIVRVREGSLWMPVCRECIRDNDLVKLETPAGDVVGLAGGGTV
jgi:hypothetical protein